MSTSESLYLAMVICAMLAFMATLAWVTYGGTPKRKTVKASRRAHREDQAAGAR